MPDNQNKPASPVQHTTRGEARSGSMSMGDNRGSEQMRSRGSLPNEYIRELERRDMDDN